ncbi:bifunctional phosphatase PAP2/diacylglycerol kinase family protein [Streptomyces sp. MP131-18]|uniref:bifunctional phosphatase PAP2/diacylglycerol kinase family protein n=1 Tax=Streptomyces sp. MP131-18 TaxID=1857892 RepID=UPI00097CBCD1|nr:bifunctional phosphatase PAP2/diacylglycerol kinase family protein [Streptomyces sp. MP131-18]ONK14523.1 putative lipid kinase BmrU [Streptomyces sp. MP131-18]
MGRLSRLDRRIFERVAAAHPPALQSFLPRLSHAADHGRLWLGAAAGLAAAGGRPGRRAALRGVAALALASFTTNTIIKYATRRQRPLIDAVPLARRLARQPLTSSFPSGHSASAAAFATGVALESGRHGAVVAPVAAAVAGSRVYVGVHYPSDVVAGCLLGVSAALATAHWWPRRPPPGRLVHHRAEAPALPEGEGLVVVINESAGPGAADSDADRLRATLPKAELVQRTGETDLGELLDEAAERAAALGGALGICGGDGSVNAAAARAAARGLPLAVFPGGTLNHFALDTGIHTFADTGGAVSGGDAIRVDLARVRPVDGAEGQDHHFLNTFSLGLYPDLVRIRESLEHRIGKWPAAAVSLARVLRTGRPVELELNGQPHRLWLLFAGNGLYSPEGFTPAHRTHLDDGLLDVRMVAADKRLARTRIVLSALTGTLPRSHVYSSSRLRYLHLSKLGEGTGIALDGEAGPAPESVLLDKLPGRLTVYRPARPGDEPLPGPGGGL